MMKGIGIGTIFEDYHLRYCADDNAYWEVPYLRPALACPIEWAPMRVKEPTGDLWEELFG